MEVQKLHGLGYAVFSLLCHRDYEPILHGGCLVSLEVIYMRQAISDVSGLPLAWSYHHLPTQDRNDINNGVIQQRNLLIAGCSQIEWFALLQDSHSQFFA